MRRDIVIGIIILAMVAGLIYWFRRSQQPRPAISTPTPSAEEEIERTFNLTIPDNLERADLGNVAGKEGTGLATRGFENGKFTLTVLANLPDVTSGTFYQVWLVKDGTNLSLGKMGIAKGGYLLEFSSNKDYSDYKDVLVSEEKVFDLKVESRILEGSF
ncbi:hypothetical protein A2361_00265 [Candidatus Woesebacteria bacterium RIFOXYB1_FULL_40_26]|uniref:Anti-sigma K factor RskA C-terminal domain-containing protein n=2 Tax=Candidatus Woeseibacteriota TaxID=1752722 RepID=A0A1F8D1E3_9BACT|nr:MAG: hypothetical protein A2361_00265 [Candidatus Woesebacteria bacterium RIFOXYB1_FULL_40_26]